MMRTGEEEEEEEEEEKEEEKIYATVDTVFVTR